MAYGTYAHALTAIRECLTDAHGDLRTITAGRFAETLPEGVNEDAQRIEGAKTSKPVRVRVVAVRRNPASPLSNGSVWLRDVVFEVVVSRTVGPLERLDADQQSALEALALEDADAIEQVLCTGPNVQTTAAAQSTNICGGLLYRDGDVTATLVPGKGDTSARLEVVQRFIGTLKISPATS